MYLIALGNKAIKYIHIRKLFYYIFNANYFIIFLYKLFYLIFHSAKVYKYQIILL